ncbi:unnamed protein product [Caenorhabditis sp. 36 PRJEB53466]|nr:unnamed protein product [Caenorhabditis sp. 36 PRJEB53466]
MLLRAVVLVSLYAWAFSMYISDPAKWNRHPYLVKVLTKDVKSGVISTCSGTLLSRSIVLTSANCFPADRKNLVAQAIIIQKSSKDIMNKAMLAVNVEKDLAIMQIDPVTDEHFCDKDPYPSRVSRLNFKPSLTEATYQSVTPKEIQDLRCRVVGFTTTDDADDFASSHDLQILELEMRADEDNLMFSEVNSNSTGRVCWDDMGAPLECTVNEENKWVQVGVVRALYGRGEDKDSNSTMEVTCADVQTMQFAVFGDDTFAHTIEVVDKASVFEAQDKCF